jgi:hypothetical protein
LRGIFDFQRFLPYVLKGKDYNHKELLLPEESQQQIQNKRIDRL